MRRVIAEAGDRGLPLWATGRDSAAGFGRTPASAWWRAGAGFVGAMGLPHHVLIRPA